MVLVYISLSIIWFNFISIHGMKPFHQWVKHLSFKSVESLEQWLSTSPLEAHARVFSSTSPRNRMLCSLWVPTSQIKPVVCTLSYGIHACKPLGCWKSNEKGATHWEVLPPLISSSPVLTWKGKETLKWYFGTWSKLKDGSWDWK